MCLPACTQKIAQDLSRRNFLRAAAGACRRQRGGWLRPDCRHPTSRHRSSGHRPGRQPALSASARWWI